MEGRYDRVAVIKRESFGSLLFYYHSEYSKNSLKEHTQTLTYSYFQLHFQYFSLNLSTKKGELLWLKTHFLSDYVRQGS